MNLVGIKTTKGFLISEEGEKNSYSDSRLGGYFFNGEMAEKTFHKHWFQVKEEPSAVEMTRSQPDINYRYELIDESFLSEKVPLQLTRDEATYLDGDGDRSWKAEYKHLQSLYRFESDKQPNIKVKVEFQYRTVLEMDEVKEFNGFSYPVQRTQWASDGLTTIDDKDVSHQLLDKILFPTPVLNMLPCQFSSVQMYKIIREHIKQNINPEAAEITSDYNFCLTVVKKIKLDDPIKREIEQLKTNGKSFRNPKVSVRYQNTRQIKIFEMTNDKDRYQGYTAIPGMVGNDLEDLQIKVESYLKELMKMINEPLVDCPNCKGCGVITK